MSLNKNLIITVAATLFLIASIFFAVSQKRNFNKTVIEAKQEAKEINKVAQLEKLWKAKGMVGKLNRILNAIPSNKKPVLNIKRTKANFLLKNLNEREFNRVLSRLSSLPIRYKNLKVTRNGDNFTLECLCDW